MEYSVSSSNSITSIKLTGQFTFSDTHKFKNILDLIYENRIKSMTLDFSDVTFIDSSCMGMLLLLRDECMARNTSLNIQSPQGQVEKIFHISKFHQLFSIN